MLLIWTCPKKLIDWKKLRQGLNFILCSRLNSLPKDSFLDWTKFKAFADNKLDVAKMIISVFERIENIVGK